MQDPSPAAIIQIIYPVTKSAFQFKVRKIEQPLISCILRDVKFVV